MDSVIMTTPTNTMRLRSRLRSAANTLCARNSKRSVSFGYKTHNPRCSVVGTKNFNRNNINNVNNQNQQRNHLLANGSVKNDRAGSARFIHLSTINREVYNAWCGRLGDCARIPSDSVQALFNDMQLYPSKNQVLEMLQCARQCGRRNNSQFLTFGEFCVFAGELRRGGRGKQSLHHHNNHHNNHLNNQTNTIQKVSKPLTQCEVFLGGSCNPTTWRADIAIPALKKLGITYYNPQVSQWSPDLMAAEHDAKESATVLLFVIDSQTRCVAGMLEVAHLIAKQRCLVIVAHPFTAGQSIMGEQISPQEFVDLSEGQSTLLTLVKNQGVAVHSNLKSALQCTVNILRGPENLAERKLTDKLMKLREIFDSVDTNRTGELSLSEVSHAYYQLTGTNLRISDLRAIMDMSQQSKNTNSNSSSGPEDVRISFEEFCSIVAEFTTGDGCNSNSNSTAATVGSIGHNTSTDGANRFSNPIYWKLAMLRTQQLLRNYVVRPIVNVLDWLHHPLQRQSSTNNNSTYEQKNGFSRTITNKHHDNTINYDIYLGGSCIKRTNWRQNVAIPLLKRYGVTYYNPVLHEQQTNNENDNDNGSIGTGTGTGTGDLNDNNETSIVKSASNDLLYDLNVMNDSKIVLFVITNETRSITSMILAAYYIAMKKNVVLCVQPLDSDECTIGPDTLTKQSIKDYNRARAYLTDLAKHENIPTYESVQEAVECAVDLLRTTQPGQKR